jgi:rod shape-determining protein MreC
MAPLALVVVLAGTAALFVLARGQEPRSPGLDAARRMADSVLAPVERVIGAPVIWVHHAGDSISAYIFAGSQNRALKAQLNQALSWQDKATALQADNDRLRALLGVKTDPPLPMVLGRTVLDARGPFANTRLVDVGAARGVMEGNPVLSDHGLVGRIVGVAPNASRIMLLTDTESRTPVLLSRTNGRAILTGDGGANPSLAYLRTHDPIRVGDRVLTSGDGGVLPRGLPVGVAVKGLDGAWRVALDSDAVPIDYVRVLLFRDFSQLVPAAALAHRSIPSIATGAPQPSPSAGPAAPATAPSGLSVPRSAP